jgi:hypothetical protein
MAAAAPAATKTPAARRSSQPLRLEDLEGADQLQGQPAAAVIAFVHDAAVARGCDQYIDPATGYKVFTALYLGRRTCCGNACRHCPYDHANVGKKKKGAAAAAEAEQEGEQQQQGGGGSKDDALDC